MVDHPLHTRMHLWCVLYSIHNDVSYERAFIQSRSTFSKNKFWQVVNDAMCYLNLTLKDIRWEARKHQYNHHTLFPYYVQFVVDTMPVMCYGGYMRDVTHQPKYGTRVYKFQVASDLLGNMILYDGPHVGAHNDGRLWNEWGAADFRLHEVGLLDGAYRGQVHVIVPIVGRGNLNHFAQTYNKGHSTARALAEHQFALVHSWGAVRNVWRKSAEVLHDVMKIIFNITQFVIRRKCRRKPLGPWSYLPQRESVAPAVIARTSIRSSRQQKQPQKKMDGKLLKGKAKGSTA